MSGVGTFLGGMGAFLLALVEAFNRWRAKRASADAQEAADAIARDPAGAFLERFRPGGVRDDSAGADAEAGAADAGERGAE